MNIYIEEHEKLVADLLAEGIKLISLVVMQTKFHFLIVFILSKNISNWITYPFLKAVMA